MNLDRKTTDKGCLEYVDPDMRGLSVPIKIPAGFIMYRVCGNPHCLNAQHMYFVDGDQSHQIEIGLREVNLKFLRDHFKVDHETLKPLEKPKLAADGQPRIWLPG